MILRDVSARLWPAKHNLSRLILLRESLPFGDTERLSGTTHALWDVAGKWRKDKAGLLQSLGADNVALQGKDNNFMSARSLCRAYIEFAGGGWALGNLEENQR